MQGLTNMFLNKNYRANIFTFRAILSILFLMQLSSCTLKSRNKTPVSPDKKTSGDITVETQSTDKTADNTTTQTPNVESPNTPSNEQVKDDKDKKENSGNPDESGKNSKSSEEEFKSLQDEFNSPDNMEKKRLTGFSHGTGLMYTDASDDFLVPYLRILQDNLPESEFKKASFDFAKKLDQFSFSQNADTITISFKYKNSDKEQSYVVLSSELVQKGQYTQLTEKNHKQSVTKGINNHSGISGELKCLDLHSPINQSAQINQSSCSTLLLKVDLLKTDLPKLSQNSILASAQVVLRISGASVYVIRPNDKNLDEPKAKELTRIFENSTKSQPEYLHFKSFELESYAVVNGKAGFKATLISNMNDRLSFKGPLVTPIGKKPLRILLNHSQRDNSENNSPESNSSYLHSLVDSARLVSNNGQGKIQINLAVLDQIFQKNIYFAVGITKKKVPIINLTPDSVYFNPR